MQKTIEELTGRIEQELASGESLEAMQLKLKLETAASNVFLALGWMLRDGRVELEASEHGYRIRSANLGADQEREAFAA